LTGRDEAEARTVLHHLPDKIEILKDDKKFRPSRRTADHVFGMRFETGNAMCHLRERVGQKPEDRMRRDGTVIE
jgi:hypothetical protein